MDTAAEFVHLGVAPAGVLGGGVWEVLRFHATTTSATAVKPPKKITTGMIQATRSKPVVVGADSTVGPYLATKPARITWSESPRSMAAFSSLRICSELEQPTWLHSSITCPQPHWHISACPRRSKRLPPGSLSPPAPISSSALSRISPMLSR